VSSILLDASMLTKCSTAVITTCRVRKGQFSVLRCSIYRRISCLHNQRHGETAHAYGKDDEGSNLLPMARQQILYYKAERVQSVM